MLFVGMCVCVCVCVCERERERERESQRAQDEVLTDKEALLPDNWNRHLDKTKDILLTSILKSFSSFLPLYLFSFGFFMPLTTFSVSCIGSLFGILFFYITHHFCYS